MRDPQLIIFDCDGVLIDSEVLAHKASVETLALFGIQLRLEDTIHKFTGLSEASTQSTFESKYGVKAPQDFRVKRDALRKRLFEDELKEIEGVRAFVSSLSVPKCIASGSSPERLRHTLELVGLWDMFDPFIFSATQVAHGKPAPDLFLFAAAQMNIAPAACLVIEDSIAGVTASKAAGMQTVGFVGASHCDPGHTARLLDAGAERVFGTMREIGDFFRSGFTPRATAHNVS